MFTLKREESFGMRLTKALIYRDMKPHELAVKMGVSDGTISQYRKEDGIDPKIDRVAIIANILQVNPVWLLGYSVPMILEPQLRKPTQEELDIIERYNESDESTKKAVCAILGLTRSNTDSDLLKAAGDKD